MYLPVLPDLLSCTGQAGKVAALCIPGQIYQPSGLTVMRMRGAQVYVVSLCLRNNARRMFLVEVVKELVK